MVQISIRASNESRKRERRTCALHIFAARAQPRDDLANGPDVAVRINDRGSFVRGRCIDLSRAAANAIGMGGSARVTVE
jgi:hypothetical protein